MTFLRLACLLSLATSLACTPGPQHQPGNAQDTSPTQQPGALDPSTPLATPEPVMANQNIEIIEQLPAGEAQTDSVIRVRFSQPVAPLSSLDEEDAKGFLTLDPPTKGEAAWLAPDLLTFTPENHLPRGHNFTVTLTEKLGKRLGKDGSPGRWRFQTPAPTIQHLSPEARQEDVQPDALVYVRISDPVDLAQLKKSVHAFKRPWDALKNPTQAAQGDPIPISIKPITKNNDPKRPWHMHQLRKDHDFTIQATKGWPIHSTIELRFDKDLVTRVGPRPLGKTTTHQFRTYGPLKVQTTPCTKNACVMGQQYATVSMNHILVDDQKNIVTIEPKPKKFFPFQFDNKHYNYQPSNKIQFQGNFKPDQPYTVTIQPHIKDIYGQTLGNLTPLR